MRGDFIVVHDGVTECPFSVNYSNPDASHFVTGRSFKGT